MREKDERYDYVHIWSKSTVLKYTQSFAVTLLWSRYPLTSEAYAHMAAWEDVE